MVSAMKVDCRRRIGRSFFRTQQKGHLSIMPTKKPTDLKSVSLGQINDLEKKTVVGGATPLASRESKAAKDDAKLERDRAKQLGTDGSTPSDSKDRSDGRKTSRDMKKVAGDAR
jgi:hypothetical protein